MVVKIEPIRYLFFNKCHDLSVGENANRFSRGVVLDNVFLAKDIFDVVSRRTYDGWNVSAATVPTRGR